MELSIFRDNILTTSNHFYAMLQRKYGIKNAKHILYDPAEKKLVSIFHPGNRAARIEHRPEVFRQTAKQSVLDAIRQLMGVWEISVREIDDGNRRTGG